MKRNTILIVTAIVMVVISTSYSVAVGIVTYKESITSSSIINNLEEVNRCLSSVADIIEEDLSDAEFREWRVEELETNKQRANEFKQFVSTVVGNERMDNMLIADVKGNANGMVVNIHPIDVKRPCVEITLDYEYNLIQRKDYLYNREVYKDVIKEDAKSGAIKIALEVEAVMLLVQIGLIICLNQGMKRKS